MTLAGLLLATAGTSTFAAALTLVLPIGLVIVMLGVWWVALRRGRAPHADGVAEAAVAAEEPPPSPLGP